MNYEKYSFSVVLSKPYFSDPCFVFCKFISVIIINIVKLKKPLLHFYKLLKG